MPWRRACQPTLVFLPEESHGQRSLVGTVHRVTRSPMWLKRLSMHTRATLRFFFLINYFNWRILYNIVVVFAIHWHEWLRHLNLERLEASPKLLQLRSNRTVWRYSCLEHILWADSSLYKTCKNAFQWSFWNNITKVISLNFCNMHGLQGRRPVCFLLYLIPKGQGPKRRKTFRVLWQQSRAERVMAEYGWKKIFGKSSQHRIGPSTLNA